MKHQGIVAGTILMWTLGFLAGCRFIPPSHQAMPASFSLADGILDDQERRRQVTEFLDRLEVENEQLIRDQSQQAMLARLEREKVHQSISRRLAQAEEILGFEALQSAGAHCQALELQSAESALQAALVHLQPSPETRELEDRIKLLKTVQTHRQLGSAPGEARPEEAAGPGRLVQGYLLSAELLLAKGRPAEASGYLLGGLELIQKSRDQALQARSLARLREAIKESNPAILEHLERENYDQAGERVVGLIEQFKNNAGLRSSSSSPGEFSEVNPGRLEEILQAIQAGDFELAEKVAAKNKGGEASARLLRERLQQLKEAMKP